MTTFSLTGSYLRVFNVVENCLLGNNSQSEHCIQQIDSFKEKNKRGKPLG